MASEFKPENMLEYAIHEFDQKKIIQAIAEEIPLNRLIAARWLDYEHFSDEVVFSVLLIAITQKQLKMMSNSWFRGFFRVGKRLQKLVREALAPLPQEPSDIERKLIRAIIYRDNGEIIRLIREEGAVFSGFSPELLLMLPELSQSAVLAFLKDGLSPKLKAIVFGIFLKEVETPDLLEGFTYKERVRYANLMLHILAGVKISEHIPFYPDGDQPYYFYYFDPEHRYDPENRKENKKND